MKQPDRIVLGKMIAYCDDIDRLMNQFGRSFSDYEASIAYQYSTSTAMCILQIGELVSRLSQETMASAPQIPWRLIRGMRNLYAHDYERTKPETLWQTMEFDIPALKTQLMELLNGNHPE